VKTRFLFSLAAIIIAITLCSCDENVHEQDQMTETDTDKELISEDSEIQEVDETETPDEVADSCIWVTKENPWPESETMPANVQDHLVFNVKLIRPYVDTEIWELVFAQPCAGEIVSSGLVFQLGDRVAEIVYEETGQVIAKFDPPILQLRDSSISGELSLTLEPPATSGDVLCFDLLEVHSSADCTTGLPIQGPMFSVSSVELCPLQVSLVGESTTTVQSGEDLMVATFSLKQDCEDVEVRTTSFTVTSDTQIADFKFYDPENNETLAGPSDISIGVEHRMFTDVFTLSKGQERTVEISFDASGKGTVQISLEDFDAQGLTYGLPLPIVGLPLSWTVGIE